MKSFEGFVFDHQRRYANRFGNGFVRNAAIPFTRYLAPGKAVLKLLEDQPDHNARALKRRLAAANPRVGHNMPTQLDPVALLACFRFHAAAPDYATF